MGGFRFPEAPTGAYPAAISEADPRRFRRRKLEAVRSSDRVRHTQPPELWDLWKTRFSKGWEPARQSPQLELGSVDAPTGGISRQSSPTDSAEDPKYYMLVLLGPRESVIVLLV